MIWHYIQCSECASLIGFTLDSVELPYRVCIECRPIADNKLEAEDKIRRKYQEALKLKYFNAHL